MNNFETEDVHEHVGLIFDQSKKQEIEERHNLECTVVDDKTKVRLSNMMTEISKEFDTYAMYLNNTVKIIRGVDDPKDAFLAMAGVLPAKDYSYMICLICIERTIMLLNDQVSILKDIQELAKQYADK